MTRKLPPFPLLLGNLQATPRDHGSSYMAHMLAEWRQPQEWIMFNEKQIWHLIFTGAIGIWLKNGALSNYACKGRSCRIGWGGTKVFYPWIATELHMTWQKTANREERSRTVSLESETSEMIWKGSIFVGDPQSRLRLHKQQTSIAFSGELITLQKCILQLHSYDTCRARVPNDKQVG
jgi:hypothetical protein